MKLAALFSGGKDSTYSIYKAKQMGHDVTCLVTIFPKSPNSHLLHFSSIELTKLQSQTLKIPHIISTLDSDELTEEMDTLKILLENTKRDFQIEGLVHGGISSEFQKKCFGKVCEENNLEVITPLWKINPKEYMNDLIDSNFKFILTSVSSDGLDQTWLGKIISTNDVSQLNKLSEKYGFNLNFEGGEAETFVVDCPLYSYPITINKSKVIWDGYRGRFEIEDASLDEELIKELSKDVQRSLLQSDVNVRLVLEITKNIENRSLNEKPPPGLSRKDHIVKILYDELAKLLGNDTEFHFKSGKVNKVLLLGIQGSGKTTVASKLARFLSKQGYRVGVIGADTFRPGALVQLQTMCEKSDVEVYGDEKNKDSPQIVKNGLKHFESSNLDIILIDTAGRHKEEKDLLDEMKQINKVASPDLALLVIDGTIGQQCHAQAEAFHKTVSVGGIIITKLDSSAKGGGALAASATTGAQVMYIGTGERVDDLEIFSPTRFVGRLLGMGDIQAVLDLAKRLENEADDVRMKRISTGKMNMEDFYFQLEEVTKVGSFQGLLDSMPGLSGMVKEDQLDKMEERIDKWRYIIQSMNKAEKANPDLLNASRVKRIARGSGWPEHEVKELIKNYKNSKNMMKASKGRQMQGFLRKLGMG